MDDADLLTVKEAARLYDPRMNPEVFRRRICPILAERHGLRIRLVRRRVIRVLRPALEALIKEERGQAG
jgi:hypothetical protein